MTEVEIQSKYTKHKTQRLVMDAVTSGLHKFYVLNCGRGWGKSVVIEDAVLYFGFSKKRDIFVLAPTDDQVKKANFQPIADRLREVEEQTGQKLYKSIKQSPGKYSIRLINGTRIDFKSAHKPDSIRGANKYNVIIIDEFAHCHKGNWNEFLQITKFKTVEMALLCSTPNGFNHFYDAYRMENDFDNWRSFRFKSTDNTREDPEVFRQLRSTLPDGLARQEMDAEFISDGFGIFKNIEDHCVREQDERPIDGDDYYIGIDIHGGGVNGDSTSISIYNQRSHLVHLIEFNNSSMNYMYQRIKKVLQTWQPKRAVIEINTDLKLYEDLRKEFKNLKPFRTTSGGDGDKKTLIDNYRLAMDCGEIVLIKNDTFKSQHNNFVMKRTASGNYTYRADEGGHDDHVMSAALGYKALYEAGLKGSNFSFSTHTT